MPLRISTKGRYALRVMIDIAEHDSDEFLPLKEIAARQEISEKYLESILVILSKEGYLHAQRGKGGGYRLAKEPERITAGEILRVVEGDLAPVACLAKPVNNCPRLENCKTLKMWKDFYRMTNEYFDGISIADLRDSGTGADYYVI